MNTTVKLFSGVPLDPNYNHVIDFPASTVSASKALRDAWFATFTQVIVEDELSQVKPTIPFVLEIDLEEAFEYNYLTFKNEDAGKLYYCFIDRVEFVSDLATRFYVTVDTYQTYLFDFEIGASFIAREHQDRVQKVAGVTSLLLNNTKPEPISYGQDYVVGSQAKVKNSKYQALGYNNVTWFVIISSEPITVSQTQARYAGVPASYYIALCHDGQYPHRHRKDTLGGDGGLIASLEDVYQYLSDEPQIISISAIPTLPFEYDLDIHRLGGVDYVRITSPAFRRYQFLPTGADNFNCIVVDQFASAFKPENNYLYFDTQSKTIDGYTQASTRLMSREGKLRTSPFSFTVVTDNQSEPLILKNEYLTPNSSDQVLLRYLQSLSPSCKYKVTFNGGSLLGDTLGKEVMIVNNKIRELPLETDAWLQYERTQRASQIAGLVGSGVGVGIGALGALALAPVTGGLSVAVGLAGAGAGLGTRIAQFQAREREIKAIPDTIRANGNDLIFDLAEGNTLPLFYRKEITNEYKQTVYDYLYYYGYTCNQVKTPNLQSRYYFNHIQTVGVKLTPKVGGAIPNDAIKELKGIYDRGVTIYHVRVSTQSNILSLGDTYENAEMSIL